MRESFHQDLEAMNRDIAAMSALVVENLANSAKAFKSQDKKLAKEVIEADVTVNDYELAISTRCIALLALEQPVASDLRHIVACLKAVSDIERIGDYAVHAARQARETMSPKLAKVLVGVITKMIELGIEMLNGAVKALLQADQSLARSVVRQDDKMDALKKHVYHDLLESVDKKESETKEHFEMLVLSRFLERLGDHAVHICSWAIYSATGILEEL